MAVLVVAARFAAVGSDSYWLVALGRDILRGGAIPDGVPFAAAPSAGWPNVLVVAELLLTAVAYPGPWGLVALQLVVDALVLVLLAAAARRAGASDGATAVVTALAALGSLPALVSVKLQVLSLLCFVALLALLRAEHHRPSRRIWLLVPLVAGWGNLHGAVLMGLAVAGCYLALSRLRRAPVQTVAVGLACVAALFANPALVRTGSYYVGVLGNEAAQRGTQLWARPSFGDPFDVLLLASGAALLLLALRSRPPLWELVAMLGLAGATVTSARHGVWLLLAALVPAARALTRRPNGADGADGAPRADGTDRVPPVVAVAGLAALVTVTAVIVSGRGPSLSPSNDPRLLDTVAQVARGRVVLADEPLAESLAAAGSTVWLSNPIDAFARRDQAAFLDFLSGTGGTALGQVDVVAVTSGSPADALVAGSSRFRRVAQVAGSSVYDAAG